MINTINFDLKELHSEASRTLDWYGTYFNVDIKRMRHAKYVKTISKFLNLDKNEALSESNIKEYYMNLNSAAYECHSLILIKYLFSKTPANDVNSQAKESIKKFLGGSTNPTNQPNHAKNFQIELEFATKLKRIGFEIDIINKNLADIVAKQFMPHLGIKINLFVECKCITSLSNLKKNIEKAGSQIDKRLIDYDIKKNEGKNLGITYIDISKLIILPEPALYDTTDKCFTNLQHLFYDFLYSQERLIAAYTNKFKHQLGIIFTCSKFIFSIADKTPCHFHYYHIIPARPESTSDNETINIMFGPLNNDITPYFE